jgi:hypothetical protein
MSQLKQWLKIKQSDCPMWVLEVATYGIAIIEITLIVVSK